MVANAEVTADAGPTERGGRLRLADDRGAPPGFELVLDVTGIVDVPRRRLTGVERVIIDGVDALDRRLGTLVRLCRYDREARRFAAVSRAEYWRCVSDLRAAGSGIRVDTEVGGPAGRFAPARLPVMAGRPSRRGLLTARSSVVGMRVRELRTVASAFARVGLLLARPVCQGEVRHLRYPII